MDTQQVLQNAQDALTARRVFGDPIEVNGATVLPVAVVGGGGGGGNGLKNGQEGSGVGFGLRAKPAGIFVIRDGRAVWRPAVNVNWIIAGGQLVALAGILALRSIMAARRPRHDAA
jgi:uncharacterized spore protein YtfJ